MATKECICSRGKGECKKVSEAYAELGDARSSFTQIPQLVPSSQEGQVVESNPLREALLRHILPDHKQRRAFDDSDEPKYIANHHFPPKIVSRCAVSGEDNDVTLPQRLTERELILLKIKFSLADMVTDEFATPTGEFYVVPNYSFHRTVRDLKKCAKWLLSTQKRSSQRQLSMLDENESFSSLQNESFSSLQSSDLAMLNGPLIPSPKTKRQLLLLEQSESFSSLRSTDEQIFQPDCVVPINKDITEKEGETENSDEKGEEETGGDSARETNTASKSGSEEAPAEAADEDDQTEDIDIATERADTKPDKTVEYVDNKTVENSTEETDTASKSGSEGASAEAADKDDQSEDIDIATEGADTKPEKTVEDVDNKTVEKSTEETDTASKSGCEESSAEAADKDNQSEDVAPEGTDTKTVKAVEDADIKTVENSAEETDTASKSGSEESPAEAVDKDDHLEDIDIAPERADTKPEKTGEDAGNKTAEVSNVVPSNKKDLHDTAHSEQAPTESAAKKIIPEEPALKSEQTETDVLGDKPMGEASKAIQTREEENGIPSNLERILTELTGKDELLHKNASDKTGTFSEGEAANTDDDSSDDDEESSDGESQDPEGTRTRSEQALLKWDEMLRVMSEQESQSLLESSTNKIGDQEFFKEFVQIMATSVDPETGDFSPKRALSECSNLSLDWLDLLNILENEQLDRSFHSEQASTDEPTVLEDCVDIELEEDEKEALDCKISFLHTASPFIILSEANNRDENNFRMLEYESRRSAVHQSELEAIRLRWRSTVATLQAGLGEAYRAERMAAGCAQANQIFASTMAAISEDVFLDERGEIISSDRKKKQLFESRRNLDYSVASIVDEDCSDDDRSCASVTNNETDNTSMGEASNDGRRGGMLGPLLEHQSAVAAKLSEDSQLMTDGICQEITKFRSDFEIKIEKWEQLGKATIKALEAIEARVVEGYEELDAVAARAYGTGVSCASVSPMTPRKRSGSDSSTSSPEPGKEKESCSSPSSPTSLDCFPSSEGSHPDAKAEPSEEPDDPWLAEMRYRVLVAYQAFAWEKFDLPKLFQSGIELERERETRLHELLLAFLPRQRRLLTGASPSKVLEELKNQATNEFSIKTDIEAVVVQHSHELLEEDLLQNHLNEVDILPPLTESPQDSFELDLSATPLSSTLVLSSAILEKRKGWLRWTPKLAVVTADLFLHLFTMSSSDSGLSPDEVFRELVPVFDSFRGEDDLEGPKESTRKLLKKMHSFFLPDCSITISADNGRQFEVVQHYVGLFGQSAAHKIVLRTESAEETSRWLGALLKKELPGGTDPESFDDVELEEKSDSFAEERAANGSPKVPGSDAFNFDRLSYHSPRRDESNDMGASSHHTRRLFNPALSFRSIQPEEGGIEEDGDTGNMSDHVLGLTA